MSECKLNVYKKERTTKLKHLSVPDIIEVRGKKWNIYYESNMPPWAVKERVDEEMEEAWGITFPSKKTIILADDLKKHGNKHIRDIVLVHELMHSSLPIGEYSRRRIIGPYLEERVIDAMAPVMLEIFSQLKWRK